MKTNPTRNLERRTFRPRKEVTEPETSSRVEKMTEIVNDTHAKYCSNCGKKIEKPIQFKGYFFCSQKCRESFTTPRGRVRGGKNRRNWRGGKAKRAAG
jgi:predicted nucleic acid-binding Zn ribbon protein